MLWFCVQKLEVSTSKQDNQKSCYWGSVHINNLWPFNFLGLSKKTICTLGEWGLSHIIASRISMSRSFCLSNLFIVWRYIRVNKCWWVWEKWMWELDRVLSWFSIWNPQVITLSDAYYETRLKSFMKCENWVFETLIKCKFIFYWNLNKVLKKNQG
jgi:hypothetical protein